MATHSSILAWKIPSTEEPGWLQSIGVARVRHDLVTKPPYIKQISKKTYCIEQGTILNIF